jgi:7-cyano-7-deazaguanine synthase
MKVISQLSGGFDSVASTLLVAKSGVPFSTIFFNIDQVYLAQELAATSYVIDVLKELYPNYIGHLDVKLPVYFNEVDENVPVEYIPIRNMMLGTSSMNIAIAKGYDTIAVGNKTIEVRPDDPYSFADCSIEFYKRMGELGTFASQGKQINFIMPLVKSNNIAYNKDEVIEICINAGLDVTKIWSCYNAGEKYCGNCYHCDEIKKTKYSNLFF